MYGLEIGLMDWEWFAYAAFYVITIHLLLFVLRLLYLAIRHC